MKRRLTVIGLDPALPVRELLTLRARDALAAADAVLADPEVASWEAVLRDECPAASWRPLAAGEQVDQGTGGDRLVWLVAGDPLSRSWEGLLRDAEQQGWALEVLPSARGLPVRTARPLDGVRVLVTRPRHQAGETCRLLEERGARTVCMPTIEIVDNPEAEPLLDQALARQSRAAPSYDYLVLTSANGVGPLGRALERQQLDARVFAGITVCAIGPGTARALQRIGLRADLVPEDHRAEGLVDALGGEEISGKRVLLPRAEVARDLLPRELVARGADVDLIPVYRAEVPPAARTRWGLEAVDRRAVDVLTFTSASTATNFAQVLCGEGAVRRRCSGLLVVAIGPVTRDACERAGLAVDLMPERYTLTAMVDALQQHLMQRVVRDER